MKPNIQAFFDHNTSAISYIINGANDSNCAIIDPILDYDPVIAKTSTTIVNRMIDYIDKNNLNVEWILETHAHSDHLSAAGYLKKQLGGRTGIGNCIIQVQKRFNQLFNLSVGFKTDGSQFDHLFADEERFQIGSLEAQVLHTPGHTPACVTYVIADVAFVGDTLLMPDYGTARADFPGASAEAMYNSIQRIYKLPEETRLFTGHDYLLSGRQPRWESTVAEQKACNLLINSRVSKETFIQKRTERDHVSSPPQLILHALQINIQGGELPLPEDNGISYLKLPLNQL